MAPSIKGVKSKFVGQNKNIYTVLSPLPLAQVTYIVDNSFIYIPVIHLTEINKK